jgi:hypothetical protein
MLLVSEGFRARASWSSASSAQCFALVECFGNEWPRHQAGIMVRKIEVGFIASPALKAVCDFDGLGI